VLILLLGGARSGKSDLAVRLAQRRSAPVVLIATAEPCDADMAARIARHRAERPLGWETIEAPVELEAALATVPSESSVIVDCLTLWTANVLAGHDAAEIAQLAAASAALAQRRDGLTIVVSNEVGMGIVPDNQLARSYRDVLGRVNATWAAAADRALLLVAGRALALADPWDIIGERA
jgi:adenosylcobinamide kinase / adenosylcobinamide-phosphate guanylyltransferase